MKKLNARACDYCGTIYEPIRIDQRFCKRDCHYRWFLREKQEALAAWRKQKRMASFFASPLQPVDETTDEDTRIRRTG
jgi:hypothetical protein